MMKRLAVIATVLAISLGLTGCANTGAKSSAEATAEKLLWDIIWRIV